MVIVTMVSWNWQALSLPYARLFMPYGIPQASLA
jgi:hypothetical protein